jgi:dipeptidyl aminopeptidase/acylaminoacyl peptidase
MKKLFVLALAACQLLLPVAAAQELLAPNANLRAEGIPPIPAALVKQVGAYTEFRGHGFVDWHPGKREMLVRHRSREANVAHIYLQREPGGALEKVLDFAEPVGAASFEPRRGRYLVYTLDAGGNEASRAFRFDLESRASTLLSDPDMASEFTWNRSGDALLITSVPLDRTAQGGKRESITTTLALVDPLKPEAKRTLTALPGTGWFAFRFAPDDKSLAMIQYRSASDTTVWRLDAASGAREQLLPTPGSAERAAYFGFEFSADGKRLFLITNERSEFLQLAEYDFGKKSLRILSDHVPWDAKTVRMSEDGARLLAVFNVNGRDEARLFDPVTGKEIGRPALPSGQIGELDWHLADHREIAFTSNSPQSPASVWSYHVDTGKLVRWTTPITDGVDPSTFADAQIVNWKSFDGREISGILYLPPAKFSGKRPVLVSIHGGPEAQSTVNFNGRYNYLINELGIALLEPNVRGSSGFGKTFIDLDNGFKREDSVKDIGALLDWLPSHPRLDSRRVVVDGGSYGGYMVHASLVHYSDRLRGGIADVGIANFVSFLQNTESYRRDLRRAEYGDERDPAMRAFLEKISPVNNAEKIRAPLFVIHGRNDPRVPYTEAEQIVAAVRKSGVPVWYLLADNEGHGFRRKDNADFRFYAMVKFLERTLLAK